MLNKLLKAKPGDSVTVFVLKSLFLRFNEHNIAQAGGQLAYFFLLSVFPFLIFLNALIGSFNISETAVIDILAPVFPEQIVELVSSYVEHITQNQSMSLLSFGIVVVIFSASRSVRTLGSMINNAYGIDENRGIFRNIMLSMMFILMLGILVLISVFFVAFSQDLAVRLHSLLRIPVELVSVLNIFRWLSLIMTMFFVLALLYYVIPNKKLTFFGILPGTLLSTAGFVALSFCFSLYVEYFMKESALYGTLGAVLLLTLWLYVASVILLAGAELNGIIDSLPNARNLKE
ncbi:MAG: YihY/virulence factor BrkB family protein [Clostridiales bacterium]|nr:YihY/virulence factor BrkB family protein [Clostridiales bacterium]